MFKWIKEAGTYLVCVRSYRYRFSGAYFMSGAGREVHNYIYMLIVLEGNGYIIFAIVRVYKAFGLDDVVRALFTVSSSVGAGKEGSVALSFLNRNEK